MDLLVLPTSTCPASCVHCCTNSSPDRKASVPSSVIEKVAGELKTISTVIFSGGEPLLAKATVLATLKYCASHFIRTRLVTSAAWAVSEVKARAIWRRLRDANLSEVAISWDDYHEPFIPFERVKTAWWTAKEFGFDIVTISNSHGPKSKWNPESIQDALGERIAVLRGDHDISSFVEPVGRTRYGIVNQHLQRIGRGKLNIPRDSVGRRDSREAMALVCPSSIVSPALTPRSHLVACGGMELGGNEFLDFGSVEARSAADVYREAHVNIVAQAMRFLGPGFIMKLIARAEGIDLGDVDYISICEVCQDLTTDQKWAPLLRKHKDKLVPHILEAAKKRGMSCQVTAIAKLPAAKAAKVSTYAPIERSRSGASPLFG